MDKSIFIKKIFEDVNILIDNYLNNRQFVSYERWEELDGFVYEKYPFLSIAFLVKANSSESDYYEFISKYKDSISLEVKNIKEMFLFDVDDELKKLQSENNDLTKKCNNLNNAVKELQDICFVSNERLKSAVDEIAILNERIRTLENGKPVINMLTREQIVAIWSNFYTLPYINDNAMFDENTFDIGGFIEELSTNFSITITSEELFSNNTLGKIIVLLQNKQSCYKKDFDGLLKKYPQKKEMVKEITDNNVTQIILSCCPRMNGGTHKYVFGIDTLEKAQLDVEKLNSILYYNFGLIQSNVESIRSSKNIDELKVKILGWHKEETIIRTTRAVASSAKEIKEKLSQWFH